MTIQNYPSAGQIDIEAGYFDDDPPEVTCGYCAFEQRHGGEMCRWCELEAKEPKPLAYYNENDPKAAVWLRELIKEGLIAPGDVDERSILDVRPHELTRYTQQHFFAGIGGWSYALRLAGVPDTRPIRTGSCPCQPFSQAGKQLAEKDERHLWPAFRDLITFGEATITFGEQVASPLGREWLVGVRADLEGLGYAIGAADLCAAGVGAPHPRQRIYWMAYAECSERRPITKRRDVVNRSDAGRKEEASRDGADYKARRMGDADSAGSQPGRQAAKGDGHGSPVVADGGASRLADTGHKPARRAAGCSETESGRSFGDSSGCGAWSDFDILPFRDGKFRRVESGTFPLAHGVSGRVGLPRGYGNAIVPQVAAEFIKASLEAIEEAE